MNIDQLLGLAAVILFIWSAVLVWATWQVRLMIRSLTAERQELRRWARLRDLSKSQSQKWQ